MAFFYEEPARHEILALVNNALSILAKEGCLDFVPNQGFAVHRLTMDEAECLYEIREILEIGTIGKTIREINDAKLKVLENRMNDYKQAISDRVHRKLFILDTEFHAAIIELINNPILTDRYRDVCRKILLRFRVEDLEIGRIEEIVKEHEALFDVVRIRDVDRAKGLIQEHHASSRKKLFAIIFRKEISGGKINTPKSSQILALETIVKEFGRLITPKMVSANGIRDIRVMALY